MTKKIFSRLPNPLRMGQRDNKNEILVVDFYMSNNFGELHVQYFNNNNNVKITEVEYKIIIEQ